MRRATWGASEFSTWATQYGVRRLAADLRVTDESIYQWLRGATSPRPQLALRTAQLSGGRVTVETIYRHAETARGTSYRVRTP